MVFVLVSTLKPRGSLLLNNFSTFYEWFKLQNSHHMTHGLCHPSSHRFILRSFIQYLQDRSDWRRTEKYRMWRVWTRTRVSTASLQYILSQLKIILDMHTQEQIENAYQGMVERYKNRKMRKATWMQSVAQLLLDHQSQIWWFAWEILWKNTSTWGWVSHRWPARASDLAIKHPNILEDRKVWIFKVYRLRLENLKEINEFLEGKNK